MQVIILAGGRGSRLAEETSVRPKPMVEVGGKPIIWHIMQIYASHGFKDFIIACGYKGEMIKEYFSNFLVHNSDVLVDLKDGSRKLINSNSLEWRIRVVDTGSDTMTGGRILRLKEIVESDSFMVTYGDGLGDVNIHDLVEFHRGHGKLASVTAVHPPPRFGSLFLDGDRVCRFSEKPQDGDAWINGGFFLFEREVFDYLSDDKTVLEREPLDRIAAEGQLMAFQHHGFWQPMDTLRDKELLEDHWNNGRAVWRTWQ